jgi:tripartite-type tricarboxylate transporter receptor subunit TctC
MSNEVNVWRRQVLKNTGQIISSSYLASLVFPNDLFAQTLSNYPTKPIKIVIPFAAGGTLDAAIRPLSQPLSSLMGQSFIIDNRAGANGMIGAEVVAKSPADGYTLLGTSASFVLNPIVNKDIRYDIIKDFTPITSLMRGVGFVLLVHPSVQVNTLQELIALDKKSNKPLAYSSPGIGNTVHIASELFNQKAGTHFLHIPYKGSGPSLNALLAGEVQIGITPPGVVMQFIKTGKLKPLAFTGSSRLPDLPDVPLMAEVGVKDMVFEGTWMGLLGPGNMPDAIVQKIYQDTNKCLQEPGLRNALSSAVSGYVVDGSTPEQFAKQIKEDLKRYSEILKRINLQTS